MMNEITITSSIDGSAEPSLLYIPDGKQNFPLLVGLHTWSFDRHNQVEDMLPRCEANGWGLLLPEFRGASLVSNPRAPEACASQLALQDVLDAVDFVLQNYPVDPQRIFLLGGSGGGHMALMLANYAPTLWRAVSSWVPISDLAQWHGQNPNYAAHIEACCGGAPGLNAEVDAQYEARSPMTYVQTLAGVNLSVHHGRSDPSVPFSQTWDLIQAIMAYQPQKFFFDIFDGGHELRYDSAFVWLRQQVEDESASTLSK